MQRFVAAALAVALVVGALVVGAAAPANAAQSATLCSTYDGCAALGMTNHGYENTGTKSYWRMYGGHNCTNYAAYMMVRAGLSNSRPFSTSGDAWGWGHGSKHVDGKPKVGSIAWWDGDGKDDKGHVAYVEAVLSKTEVIVSEDSWGGEFDWRVITTDGGWPDGFIHYKDSKNDGVVPDWRASPQGFSVFTDQWQPANANYLKPGSTVWVQARFQNTGTQTWTGLNLGVRSTPLPLTGGDPFAAQQQPSVETGQSATFQYQVTIPADAATGTTFTTTVQPLGAGIGWLKYGKADITLRADSRDWFWSSPQPWISGIAEQGQTLEATVGDWQPAPVDLSYSWLRNGKPIAGATATSYRVKDADVGTTLSFSVAGSASGYIPMTRVSASTATVRSIHDNELFRGQTLARGDQIVSANGVYRAQQTKSGKLIVVNRFTKKVSWSSGKVGSVKTKLTSTGNLVSYNKRGKAVWKSGTTKVVRAVITNSGKLVLRTAKDKTRWNSAKDKRSVKR